MMEQVPAVTQSDPICISAGVVLKLSTRNILLTDGSPKENRERLALELLIAWFKVRLKALVLTAMVLFLMTIFRSRPMPWSLSTCTVRFLGKLPEPLSIHLISPKVLL